MREGDFNLGGEASGHIIMSDYATTGDGLIAALQVLAELVRSQKPMSALARQFEPVPQRLENVRFVRGEPLEAEAVKGAIAAAEGRLNGAGPHPGSRLRHRAPDPDHGRRRRRQADPPAGARDRRGGARGDRMSGESGA